MEADFNAPSPASIRTVSITRLSIGDSCGSSAVQSENNTTRKHNAPTNLPPRGRLINSRMWVICFIMLCNRAIV